MVWSSGLSRASMIILVDSAALGTEVILASTQLEWIVVELAYLQCVAIFVDRVANAAVAGGYILRLCACSDIRRLRPEAMSSPRLV
jgi:hypothetical protein